MDPLSVVSAPRRPKRPQSPHVIRAGPIRRLDLLRYVCRVLGFHTLNARDNRLLDWIFREFAKSDPGDFRDAMQLEAQQIRALLASRGVDYAELKSALVPSPDGVQAVFFYDWLDDPAWNYAVAFAELYLPHLRPTLRTSVFQGDLFVSEQPLPIYHLEQSLVRAHAREVNWQTQFAVYFTNLRPGDIETLHAELSKSYRYTGYSDVSWSGPIRDVLAGCLPSMWVISRNKVMLSHGGDEPFVQSEEPVGFELERFGYEVVSLSDSYFAGFLSYKIEARSSAQAEYDRQLNLAAITGALVEVDKVPVVVPEEKLSKYLLKNEDKLRLMTSIGLETVTPARLSQLIREKLAASYIYDFRFAPDGTPLFAVSAEFSKPTDGRSRRLLALKYDPLVNGISLVSMY